MTIRPRPFHQRLDGYGALLANPADAAARPDTTTEEYSHDQQDANARITRDYVEPILRRTASRSILDVGCGVGKSVGTLVEDGFDAYGVDLPGLTRFWRELQCETDRFFVVDPEDFRLPFDDAAFDLAFSFGVLEHVGTLDGHATRRADYHERRALWAREIHRVVKPGGYLLLGGPNRNFPLDFSHGLDSRANGAERWLSSVVGRSVHRPWGEYFLWGYADVTRYLAGTESEVEPLRLDGLLKFGRLPAALRGLADFYVRYLPRPLLGTGFNPWVMALVRKASP
jgi:SAM-dependent methyltransferase